MGDIGLGPVFALRLTNSLFLLIAIGFVTALFWAGIYGMHTVRTDISTRELGRRFAHAFIPIALAYLIAHYFSGIIFSEQAQFSYLLSDPLGDGSDIFGTASGGIDYGVISANAIWYVQVAALVIGHVTALVLGPRPRPARLRQRPRGNALAVLDARADGGVHLARSLPALAVQQLSLADPRQSADAAARPRGPLPVDPLPDPDPDRGRVDRRAAVA